MSGYLFHIDLPIQERWTTIDTLRVTVVGCLTTLFAGRDYCETLGMIVAELLENAHKYGRWDARTLSPAAFRLRVVGTDEQVEITVSNPIDRTSPGVARLFELLEHLGRDSAENVYLERLRAVAMDPSSSGGLGLARIAFEARCRLTAAIDAEGVLEVHATAPLGPRLGPEPSSTFSRRLSAPDAT